MNILKILCDHIFFGVIVLVYSTVCHASLLASENCPVYKQWFTGPVLTPTPITMPPGHPSLELAFLVSDTYGEYGSDWSVNTKPSILSIGPYVDFQIGFNKILGAEFIGSVTANFSRGKHSTHLRDSIFRLGFQIATDQNDSWVPDFRILLQETVPTGKYDRLDPERNREDCTGQGSYRTGIYFAFQKLFHPKKNHDFRLRWSLGYFVPAPVNVKGVNFYGGDRNTKGIVYPGKYFTSFLFGEYALSRTWAIGCEFNYQQGESGRYTRKKGVKIGIPSFAQLSIIPEIQHTFSANLGMIIGSWFSTIGKNSPAFGGAFASVLFIF